VLLNEQGLFFVLFNGPVSEQGLFLVLLNGAVSEQCPHTYSEICHVVAYFKVLPEHRRRMR
jgi:hypothetical protein